MKKMKLLINRINDNVRNETLVPNRLALESRGRLRIGVHQHLRSSSLIFCTPPTQHTRTHCGLVNPYLKETMQKSRAINSFLGSRAFAPAPRVQFQAQRRFLQDVSITRTGKPILKVQGGRYVLILEFAVASS